MTNHEDKDTSNSEINQILDNIKNVITQDAPSDETLVLTQRVDLEEDWDAQIEKDASEQNVSETIVPELASELLQTLSSPSIEKPVAEEQNNSPIEEREEVDIASTIIEPQLLDDVTAQSTKEILRDVIDLSAKHIKSHDINFQNLSLEDLVIKAIKPELKIWLNENLPLIVKHIVEKEIKRLIGNE